MALLLGTLTLAVLLTLIVLCRRPASSSSRRASSPIGKKSSAEPFRGVEIVTGLDSCEHAAQLVGKRFLLSDTPSLPLDSCTKSRCACSFKKLSDRREETRRWSDHGVEATIFAGSERRKRYADRRKESNGEK